jgi:hypothetical protein
VSESCLKRAEELLAQLANIAIPTLSAVVLLRPQGAGFSTSALPLRGAGPVAIAVLIRSRVLGAQAPLSLLYSGAKAARSSSGESKVSSSPISFPSRVTAGGSTWVRARASSRPKTVLGSSSSSTLP